MPRRNAPQAIVFFVDRSLGGKLIVEALRAVGADVVAHDDEFAQGTPDVDWLEAAGRRGYVILTKDSAIRRNPYEREMVDKAKARMFALTRKDLSGQEMAQIFVAALPGMQRRAIRVAAPFIFTISRGGVFTRIDL